jgi:hypothetical protein
VAYVRRVKIASGATAVQIVHGTRRGARRTKHVGSAHDEQELEALKTSHSDLKPEAQRVAAVMAAAAWVRGGRPAPVTERTDAPVTRAHVEAELWATFVVATPSFPAASMCVERCRHYRPPVVFDRAWALGAAQTLRWLLGMSEPSPMLLPRRHSDGSLASAEELYEHALQARPWVPLPEERRDLRLRCAADAAPGQRLDDEIRRIQRDLAAQL